MRILIESLPGIGSRFKSKETREKEAVFSMFVDKIAEETRVEVNKGYYPLYRKQAISHLDNLREALSGLMNSLRIDAPPEVLLKLGLYNRLEDDWLKSMSRKKSGNPKKKKLVLYAKYFLERKIEEKKENQLE